MMTDIRTPVLTQTSMSGELNVNETTISERMQIERYAHWLWSAAAVIVALTLNAVL
jgi:hypothetical protein